ncbi:class I adenylate-forming enzyme family protein [Chloroflexota bacterium]
METAAKEYGDKTAFVLNKNRLSFTELNQASNKLGNALLNLGVEKGDRIAMLLPNSLEFIIIYFGIVKVAAIAVPLDTRYKIDELTSLFDHCQPKVLITENTFLEPLIPVLPRFKYIQRIIDIGHSYMREVLSYQHLMSANSSQPINLELMPEDITHIAYTSGPTSHPRGSMLTQKNMLTEIIISANSFQQTDKDVVVLFALPLHHAFGLVILALTSVFKGSTVVIIPGLSISTLTKTIEKEKCTMFMGVPFIFALMVRTAMEEGIKHNLSSVRICCSAGAPIPIIIIKQFKKLYGLNIVQLWGLTEATAHVTYQAITSTNKLGSTGKVLPGWKLKIIDNNGKELPPNQSGEIIVRGPIMKGYYHNPQATAEKIKDDWLYTGDIGKLDEDSNLFILGMKKEMIITKGQNIYPSDIEEILYTHPKVAEAVVVGIPDELRGETVRAVIKLKDGESATEEEVKHFCREFMANYKVPRQIMFVDSLPKTTNGNINKADFKD